MTAISAQRHPPITTSHKLVHRPISSIDPKLDRLHHHNPAATIPASLVGHNGPQLQVKIMVQTLVRNTNTDYYAIEPLIDVL
jgi:hypothetical protein